MIQFSLRHTLSCCSFRQGRILLGPDASELASPSVSTIDGETLPLFSCLSLEEQVRALLAHRIHPSDGVDGWPSCDAALDRTPTLLRLLTGHEVPAPCPGQLLTPTPLFPWAPRLREIDTEEEPNSSKQCKDGMAMHSSVAVTREVTDACDLVKHFLADSSSPIPPECMGALHLILKRCVSPNSSKSHVDPISLSGLDYLEFDTLLLIVTSTISAETSHAWCKVVARRMVLPSLRRLDAPFSQNLAATMEHLAMCDAQALAEECMYPVVQAADILNKYQAEVLAHVIKHCVLPVAYLPEFIRAACADALHWGEPAVLVVQSAIDAKPGFEGETLNVILKAISVAAANRLCGSVRLAKLLLSLVKAYRHAMDEAIIDQARAVANNVGTFLSKTILTSLA